MISMMAEFTTKEDGNDKNFILAKLVSIFGDSVDFDVINIVAQENEWNEVKCIESLTVLGEYKNPPSIILPKEIESIQLYNQVPDTAVDVKRTESSNTSVASMPQNRKTSPYSAATAPKAAKSNRSVSGAINKKEETTQHRHHSPAPSSSPKPKERSSETQEHHDQVKNLIASGTPVLILLRGLPGSGKSSLSKQLLSLPRGKSGCTCSADDFFLVPQGGKGQKEYRYDPLRLEDAHKHCRLEVLRAIAHGVSPIIVDNTNTQAWEMLPYVEMALEPWKAEETLRKMVANGTISKRNICNSLGPSRSSLRGKKCNCGYTVMEPARVPYQVELLEPLTWWYRNPSRLAKVNQHGVSQRKITQMLSHFEYGLTGKDLIKQILKKKQHRNLALHPELQNHPAPTKVRPFKEKKSSAHLAGPPLFAARANHGTNSANSLPSPCAIGNNQFQQSSTNHFPNFVGFTTGPYTQPVLYSPSMFNIGSSGETSASKSTERKEIHVKHSSNNPKVFPGIEPSNVFSSQESEHNIDSDESSSGNVSSKSDMIGPNPFLKLVNASNQDRDTSSIFQGECIDISEEEEREWMQANASKYVDWKSSEEEESGDELIKESYEPKPARSYQGRHVNLERAKSTGKHSEASDYQDIEGEEEIAEWVTEGGDHLASWNTPSSCSKNDYQTASNVSSESKNEDPLPPRSPKKRLLVENLPKGTDDSELEKSPNPIEGHEFDWIKDVRLLLKALGLDKDNSDSAKQSSNDTENRDSTISAAVESDQKNDNPTSDSKNQDKVNSILPQIEVQIELDSENAINFKTEDLVKLDSSDVKIQGESDSEPLPPLAATMPLVIPIGENLVMEPTVMAAGSLFAKVGNNDQVTDLIVACQPEDEKITLSVLPETSGSITSVTVFDEFHDCQSKLRDFDSKIVQSTPQASVFEEIKDIYSEKSDYDIIKADVTRENETQNVGTLNDDFDNSGDKSETNSLNDKTEQGKMSVLMSLLIGIEKAQQRSPEEFESSAKINESLQNEDSKSETFELQLQEGKSQSLESDDIQREESTNDGRSDVGHGTVFNTSESGSGPPPSLTTMDENSKDPGATRKCKDHSTHQKELRDCDIFPFLPDNSSFIKESLCKGDVMKDPGDTILSSVVSLPLKESSSLFVLKENNNSLLNKTDKLLELNLLGEGNNDNSFLVVTNQDTMMHPGSSYLSGVSHNLEGACHSMDVQSNRTESITDFSLVEESIPKEISSPIDQVKDINQVPCKNPALATAQNIFEKAGNFFLKSFGSKNMNSPTSDSTYSELCNEIEATKISKAFSGREDCDVGEGPLPNVRSDSMEADRMLNCDDENNETYPLVLDPNFVDLLYKTYGNPYEEPLYDSPKLHSGPASGVTVNIPGSLARKLHECLLRSQWDSILAEDEASQKMMIEDELLARQLQELEKEDLKDVRNHRNPSSTTPNLREIMDMEMAMAMYNADQGKIMQTHQRNDMSTHLTWDLLVKEFPQIPQNVIAQIFSAYDYSYGNAREALLTSLPEYERDSHAGAVKDVVSPEAIAAQEKVLLEKAKMESLKFQQRGLLVEEENEEVDEETEEVEGSWKEMVEEARKSASLNRKLQKERHAQAQAANRSGMASAAAYYCQMATLHKQKAEEETRNAANILSKVFTGRYGSSHGIKTGASPGTAPPPTLDMHSMKVTEAVAVMNAFLDAHIEWLRAEKTRQHGDASRKSSPTKTKTLFLVTGRGINSHGGIPRIKPAVERQLEMRGVWYEEMNPGLLRVMVSANQPTKLKV